MKTLTLYIVVFLILSSGKSLGDELSFADDNSKAKTDTKTEKVIPTDNSPTNFKADSSSKENKMDGNGKRERKGRHFSDLDGDGINDNRCNGVGLKNGNNGNGQGRGKRNGKK